MLIEHILSLFVLARLVGAKNDSITGKTAGGFRSPSIRQSCPMTGLRLKRRHRPIRGYLIVRGP
ncbi:hypothetical protein Agau_C101114 [Agrobacterium tumefaciens F2]|nr:hypothetical protein Agau_C101114 [Agrobacterium tumefaciens F2]